MNVQTMTLLFALLAVVAGLFTIVTFGLWLSSRESLLPKLRDAVGPNALWLALIIALVTALGSLYFSEVAHFQPCKLCWFQRIAIYPMWVLLLIAAIRKDIGVKWYGIPMLAIGAVVSIYHYQLEWFPNQVSTVCTLETPCTTVWFRRFGFLSLPAEALIAGLTMITLMLLAKRGDDQMYEEEYVDV